MDRMTRFLAIAIAALLTVACSDDPVRPELTDVNAAEARWSSLRVSSYRMHQRVACFCGNGGTIFEVTVSGGTITRVVNLSTSADVPSREFEKFRTVSQLFTEIRSAIPVDGKLISVTYSSAMGYPSQVSLDPIKNAVDDEVTYLTENLAMLSLAASSRQP